MAKRRLYDTYSRPPGMKYHFNRPRAKKPKPLPIARERELTTFNEIFPGSEMTPDQVEFALAMNRKKAKLGRQPTCAETLAVAKKLGYVLAAPAGGRL